MARGTTREIDLTAPLPRVRACPLSLSAHMRAVRSSRSTLPWKERPRIVDIKKASPRNACGEHDCEMMPGLLWLTDRHFKVSSKNRK